MNGTAEVPQVYATECQNDSQVSSASETIKRPLRNLGYLHQTQVTLGLEGVTTQPILRHKFKSGLTTAAWVWGCAGESAGHKHLDF
jgi:hypothetical protein